MRAIMRLLLFALLLSGPLASQRALFAQATSNTATANASGGERETRRAAPSISVQTQLAAGELSRIEQQILQLSEESAELMRQEEAARTLEAVRPQVAQLRGGAGGICAASADQQSQFSTLFGSTVQRLRTVTAGLSTSFPWELAQYQVTFPCPEGQPAGWQAALQEIDNHLTLPNVGNRRTQIETELRTLRDRRDQVIQEMSEGVAGARVAKNIPWLMLIIFGVGAATLALLNFFSKEIQRELVGSGQIVQFVTILIVLGVVLALGLAERVGGETLGTLIGGLVGYVLSQGIGRQERHAQASQAARTQSPDPSSTTTPATPPATPTAVT
jgi:hypothetical protein